MSVDAQLLSRLIEASGGRLRAVRREKRVTAEGRAELGAKAQAVPSRMRPRLGHFALIEVTDAFGLAIVLAATSLACVVRPAEAKRRRIQTVHAKVAVAGATGLRRARRLGRSAGRVSSVARGARRRAMAAGQDHRDTTG